MNTQAAKKLAKSRGCCLEYTNYGETGTRKMWYLVVDPNGSAWKEGINRDSDHVYTPGELARFSREFLETEINRLFA